MKLTQLDNVTNGAHNHEANPYSLRNFNKFPLVR